MTTAGKIDTSFFQGPLYGFDKNVHDVKVQSDGKIIIAGDFENYNFNGSTIYSPYLCRLNPDGTFDYSFDILSGGTGLNDTVYSIHLQTNDKIVIGGEFTSFNRDGVTYTTSRIMRLNIDGSIDTSFNSGTGFDDTVYKLEIQTDNKFVAGGRFSLYDGQPYSRIVRLEVNGDIDTGFIIGSGFDDGGLTYYIKDVVKTGDKLLVGGSFTSYSGYSANNFIQLNSDGSINESFYLGVGFNQQVEALGVLNNGKIIVGGLFTFFDTIDLTYGSAVILNSDGTFSNGFGYGLDSQVLAIAVQPDGKILLGGTFDNYYTDPLTPFSLPKLGRFYEDGSIDSTFYTYPSYNNDVMSISLRYNEYIYIGGEFDTDPVNHFGKLYNDVELSANTEYDICILDCSGNTVSVSVPHPAYGNAQNKTVYQMNAVTLGGNGLNN